MKRNWRQHYNVFLANLVLVFGFALNILVAKQSLNNTTPQFRFLFVTPFLGVVIGAVLYFFDVKWFLIDYPYKKFHFQKKWAIVYLSGVIVFFLNVLIGVVLLVVMVNYITNQILEREYERLFTNSLPYLWSTTGTSIVLSLISIGMSKTAHFFIDIEILKAKKREPTDPNKTDNRAVVINLDENKKNEKEQSPPSAEMTSL